MGLVVSCIMIWDWAKFQVDTGFWAKVFSLLYYR